MTTSKKTAQQQKQSQARLYLNIIEGSVRAAYESSSRGNKRAAVIHFETADSFRRSYEQLTGKLCPA